MGYSGVTKLKVGYTRVPTGDPGGEAHGHFGYFGILKD